ncbi:MAG: NADH-quinone oxidoreductase subunit E [Parasphingorhabdus sp.]|jgi:NADH-quinone oxidoreductase subunit E
MLSDNSMTEIAREISKYPPEQKRSAVMASLRIAQEEHGYLTRELVTHVAGILDIPPVRAMEVATFYSMYDHDPVGRHKVNVCTNISCMICGSDDVLDHLKRKLGIGPGEMTSDKKFSIKEVECLGACGGAPMMQIGKDYFENLNPERIDQILDSLE